MRKLLPAVIFALLAIALAVPALAATPVKQAKVDDIGFAFHPGTLKIKRGTKVVWKWVDGGGVGHNVVVKLGPAKFHSKTISSGSFSHIFKTKGRYVLYCTIHPFMREVVVVK